MQPVTDHYILNGLLVSSVSDTKSNKDVMLTYDVNQILGHGADGTIVYK